MKVIISYVQYIIYIPSHICSKNLLSHIFFPESKKYFSNWTSWQYCRNQKEEIINYFFDVI